MKKGGKKKKKKEKPPYNYKYPQLNYEELKKVPLFNFTAKNGSLKNSNDDIVTGSIPIDYSVNKIKELIQQKHGNSCGNLRLFIKDENTGETWLEFYNAQVLDLRNQINTLRERITPNDVID